MNHIFVSYATQDRARVKPLVDALLKRGWTVWWDRTISVGQRWDHVIEAALTEARCVIVVWTRISIQSEWVINEAAEARRRGVLIPVLLDEVEMPLEFKRVQTANLVDWPGDLSAPGFNDLENAVTKFLANDDPAPARKTDPPKPSGPARKRSPWLARLQSRGGIGVFGVLLGGIAGYAVCYVTHWDLINSATTRARAGCSNGGMIGQETDLPEGGDSLKNPRIVSPGLYISRNVFPAGTMRFFKIRLKEYERLEINMRNDHGGYFQANIYDADGRTMNWINSDRGYATSWRPPALGWVSFSIGGGNESPADTVYGVCATTR